jgi:hypothetical protein
LSPTRVCLEVGAKRVFASALDWPGWCRSGRDEAAALEALAAYAGRYRPVAAAAGHPLGAHAEDEFTVEERVSGNATTDFGAPGVPCRADAKPLSAAETKRQAALIAACWDYLDKVAGTAPAELRKGPRGGGRDRDAMLQHVLGAEASYVRKLGIKPAEPAASDRAAIKAFRAEVQAALAAAEGGSWPPRYLARRMAWHTLDHAWEMQDRS